MAIWQNAHVQKQIVHEVLGCGGWQAPLVCRGWAAASRCALQHSELLSMQRELARYHAAKQRQHSAKLARSLVLMGAFGAEILTKQCLGVDLQGWTRSLQRGALDEEIEALVAPG